MLDYRHLYCLRVVTKEGGFTHAAKRLDMAVQTISAQVREIEKALRHQLLKPCGAPPPRPSGTTIFGTSEVKGEECTRLALRRR